jgi:hypothetical protein
VGRQGTDVVAALDRVPHKAEAQDYPDVDEGAPGVVPALAIDGLARPGEIERHPDPPDNRDDVGALLELYGSIISLCARAQRIRTILVTRSSASQSGAAAFAQDGVDSDGLLLDDLRSDEICEFDGFHQELLIFGRCLAEVNFAAIDVYFPGLRDDLLHATGGDVNFSTAYVKDIAPKYGLADRELPTTLVQILDRYSSLGAENPGGPLMLEFGSNAESQQRVGRSYGFNDIPTQVSVAAVLRIIELLKSSRAAIRTIVQENWGFRDLLDPRIRDR